jgi:hypothetical protein
MAAKQAEFGVPEDRSQNVEADRLANFAVNGESSF